MDVQHVLESDSKSASNDRFCQFYCKAKLNLVLCCFEETIEVCFQGLEDLKDDCISGQFSCRESDQRVAFVVIAIQAYAETNQWQKAVTFATQVFESVSKFPTEVLELCLGLLLKAAEFEEACELTEEWLSSEQNSTQHGYMAVAYLYVIHILVPQGHLEKAQQFVDTCEHLTPEQKQAMVSELIYHGSQNNMSLVNSILTPCQREKEACPSTQNVNLTKFCMSNANKQSHKGPKSGALLVIISIVHKLQRFYTRMTNNEKAKSLLRIFLLVFFVYAFLTASGYQGLTRGSGIHVLWQGVKHAWRAMFSPYHLVPVEN